MADRLKAQWEKLNMGRSSVMKRARDCAKLTIPGLLPPEGHNETDSLPTPYQGLGARGVNNLAAKMLLALLPPNQPSFKFEPDEDVLKEFEREDQQARSKTQRRLSRLEQRVLSHIETQGYRPGVYEITRHLIAVGNVAYQLSRDNKLKVYPLDHYVVQRDRAGNLMNMVIREMVDPETLPDDVVRACEIQVNEDGRKDCEVYTRFYRDGSKWRVYQEINDIRVPGSKGEYPLDKPGFMALRWTAIPGEDYGRGLVDEHIGDLRSFEGATKAIIRFAANASKILWLVNPNGQTRAKNLSRAESGDFVPGREEDISMLGLDKFPDFRIVEAVAQKLEARLNQAFLMNASIQRDAERVTATEVQLIARELEDALGGVYSVLAQEFQLPFIKRIIANMQSNGELPEFSEQVIKTKVTTGIEALGRGHDMQKLQRLMSLWAETIPPEILMQKLDFDDFMRRTAAAEGVPTEGLVKESQAQTREQAQQMLKQLIQDAGPEFIKQMMQQGAAPQNG